jgi:hypothetical protein
MSAWRIGGRRALAVPPPRLLEQTRAKVAQYQQVCVHVHVRAT